MLTRNGPFLPDTLSILPSFCLSSLLSFGTLVVGVLTAQNTGNVWVTHEEMESLAATPPTVS